MPDDSFYRVDDLTTRERLLPVLHKLYEYESSIISGSHGGLRRFSQCIWTKENAINYINSKMVSVAIIFSWQNVLCDLEGNELFSFLLSHQ